MRDYANDIRLRESEMESVRIAFNEDLAKKEREKTQLKHRLEEANQRVTSLEKDLADYRQQEDQRDAEVNRLRDDFEQRINEYEDTLNAKIRENQELNANLKDA
jgi:DNA anti-recombination protein RmuC